MFLPIGNSERSFCHPQFLDSLGRRAGDLDVRNFFTLAKLTSTIHLINPNLKFVFYHATNAASQSFTNKISLESSISLRVNETTREQDKREKAFELY